MYFDGTSCMQSNINLVIGIVATAYFTAIAIAIIAIGSHLTI